MRTHTRDRGDRTSCGEFGQADPRRLERVQAVKAVKADQAAEAFEGAAHAVDEEALAEVPGVFPHLPGGNGLLHRVAPRQGLGLLEGFGVVSVHARAVGAVVLLQCRLADESDDLGVGGPLDFVELRPYLGDRVSAFEVLVDQIAVLDPLLVVGHLRAKRFRFPLQLLQPVHQRLGVTRVGAQ